MNRQGPTRCGIYVAVLVVVLLPFFHSPLLNLSHPPNMNLPFSESVLLKVDLLVCCCPADPASRRRWRRAMSRRKKSKWHCVDAHTHHTDNKDAVTISWKGNPEKWRMKPNKLKFTGSFQTTCTRRQAHTWIYIVMRPGWLASGENKKEKVICAVVGLKFRITEIGGIFDDRSFIMQRLALSRRESDLFQLMC